MFTYEIDRITYAGASETTMKKTLWRGVFLTAENKRENAREQAKTVQAKIWLRSGRPVFWAKLRSECKTTKTETKATVIMENRVKYWAVPFFSMANNAASAEMKNKTVPASNKNGFAVLMGSYTEKEPAPINPATNIAFSISPEWGNHRQAAAPQTVVNMARIDGSKKHKTKSSSPKAYSIKAAPL